MHVSASLRGFVVQNVISVREVDQTRDVDTSRGRIGLPEEVSTNGDG